MAQKVQEAKTLEEAYQAEKEAELKRAERERATQEANILVSAQIEKSQREVQAQATAEVLKLEQEGKAQALLIQRKAEAEAIRQLAEGEAQATLLKKKAEGEGMEMVGRGEAAAIEAAAKEQRAEQTAGEKAPEHTAHASEKTTARSGGVGHLLALAVGLLIERGGRIRGQRFRVGLAHGRASAEGTATADTSGVGLTIGESQHDQNQYGAETGIKRLGHDVSSGWLGRHFLPLVWVLQCIG